MSGGAGGGQQSDGARTVPRPLEGFVTTHLCELFVDRQVVGEYKMRNAKVRIWPRVKCENEKNAKINVTV